MGKNSKVKKKKNTGAGKKPPAETQAKSTAPASAGKKKSLVPIIAGVVAVAAVIAVLLLSGVFSKSAPVKKDPFNLLVITLDTTRADRIGAYGNEKAITPVIDRLAKEGVMFENCYSPVPMTLPAHGSLFTGRYPLGHGIRDNGLYVMPENEITLAELLKQKGYNTFGVIAAYVLLSKFGLAQGFDEYDDSLDSHRMYNNYKSQIRATSVFRKFKQWFDNNYHTRFFAWIHLYDPHTPYSPPKRFRDKLGNGIIERYDGELAFTDEAVGKIVEALKQRKVLNQTLIVIVGDHGEAFGEHGEWGHGIFCYEEALKVPLIFYHPTLLSQKGLKVKNRVHITDIMPTLLELCNIDIPAAVQGESFLKLLTGEKEQKRRNFYFESMHGKEEMNWAPLMGIIEDQYKFISLPEPELYDLDADPLEKENLFWKKNRLARELDKDLMQEVDRLSKSANLEDARRELSAQDKDSLKSLGYISSFSNKSDKETDPKKGIVLDNEVKRIFRLMGEKKLDEAEAAVTALPVKFPEIDAPVVYDLKYQLYKQQGNVDKALNSLKEVIERLPKFERFYIMYANDVYAMGQYDEAARYARKLLKINPSFTRAHILLGQVEEQNGNIDTAIAHYKKALSIEPQNISLRLKFAELELQKKDIAPAIHEYDRLLEREEVSGNPDLLFKVGMLKSQQGEMAKSEELIKKAADIAPSGKYLFSLALIQARNKKYSQAIANMKLALDKYQSQLEERQIQIAQKAIQAWQQRASQ